MERNPMHIENERLLIHNLEIRDIEGLKATLQKLCIFTQNAK
jgi:hypothetical protein